MKRRLKAAAVLATVHAAYLPALPVGCWAMNTEDDRLHEREEQEALRRQLSALLEWDGAPVAPPVQVLATRAKDGYTEQLLEYRNIENEAVRAFLLRPHGSGPFPGVVVYHQHHSEWHLGKSEVAGVAGDPMQALGSLLARRGLVVLAPDAICFEDRRRTGGGTQPRRDDFAQHYNEMAYRLVRGSLLMSLVLADAALAVSVLSAVDLVDRRALGAVGHSMGGHTVLFSAALDQRVRFACISGAAGSYRARINTRTGIELSQVIPGILRTTDFDQLASLIAPRPLLLLSATDDPYSRDALAIARSAAQTYATLGARNLLLHVEYPGAHPLTAERVTRILDWVTSAANLLGGSL
jgi:dienelactone hydrolase